MKAAAVSTGTRRFSIARTCDGYEVIDHDGRALTCSYEHANEPLEVAGVLNAAAERGHKSLARAIARLGDPEPYYGTADEI